MGNVTRDTSSSRDMLGWQYKSLLGELQQIELHAESGDCPCIMGDLDPAEYCLAKHTLNVHTLAFETANMDISNHKALRELADEAMEKHEGVKDFVCHKGELPELSSWARRWRKNHIERIYYTCRVKGKMRQETGYHRLAAVILAREAAMSHAAVDPRQISMDRWLEDQTKAPPPAPASPSLPAPTRKFELFDFQKEGVAWLKGRSRALLGDDMGLGKTPQAIHWGADHLPALVIVPAALLWNWHREITTMWRTGDTAVVLDGKSSVPRPLPDWTILTYGMLDRYLTQLKQAGFKCVIVDEAHLVKNLEAQRTKNLLELVDPLKPGDLDRPIPNRLAVTGTPILNRPIELFALLVFLGFKRRDDLQEFLKRYTEHKYIKGRLVFTGARNLHELHELLKDIMIRRLKKDVLKSLPPKIHTPMFVPISNAEEYREAERNFLSWLRETQGTEAARNAARAETLARMNALRLLAAKGKVAPVCDWLKPCYQGQGKVIIFSSFTRPLEDLQRCSGDAVIYDGSVPKATRQEIVDRFQKTQAPCHFLGTIGAAGVGITLTASHRVAFLDLPWTPGAKQQAEDRAYRIGQTKTVEIVNVLARGTIDERMLKLLADKEFIIAQAVDGKRQDEARSESISNALMDDFMRHPVMSSPVVQYEPEAKDAPADAITEDDLRILQGDMGQEPRVTISGKCRGKEICTLKVKASESVEAVSSIGGLTRSIEDVLKKIEEAHAPPPSAITFAIGSTTLTRYEFRNKLVEASDLRASHDPVTFEPTPNYPAELQPRLRGRQANRSQVQSIAKNLDPDALLSDFHSIDRGAPIVGPDNVVESGNGRVMAIQLAAAQFPEVYARYREDLTARAASLGVSEEEARGMKAPVLVRLRLTDVPRRQFVEEANASTTLAPSAIEVARADASHLTPEMVQQLEVGGDQGIEDALRAISNGQFVSAFLATIPANQRAQITDSRGQLNQDGIRRMVMALFVNAFPGDSGLKLAEKFFESTEPGVRNVFNGIAQALGKLAKSEALCRSNRRDPALAIGEDLAAAVVVFSDIRKTPGMTVATYLNQAQMFERRLNPLQERLLRLLDERARSGKKIGQLLKGYADVVMESPPPAQGALIPGARLTKDQALDAAVNKGEAEEQATRLFQPAPRPPASYCSAVSSAAKTLQAAAKSLQVYRANVVKAGDKLETARNICRGQSVMFQQAEMNTRLPPKRLRVEPNEWWQKQKIDCPHVDLVQDYQRSKWESASYWQRCRLMGKPCLIARPIGEPAGGDPKLCPVRRAAERKDQPEGAGAQPASKVKAPTIKISGKCGDATHCRFTVGKQERKRRADDIGGVLKAINDIEEEEKRAAAPAISGKAVKVEVLPVTVQFSQRPITFAPETLKKMTRLANRTTTHERGFEMCEDNGSLVPGPECTGSTCAIRIQGCRELGRPAAGMFHTHPSQGGDETWLEDTFSIGDLTKHTKYAVCVSGSHTGDINCALPKKDADMDVVNRGRARHSGGGMAYFHAGVPADVRDHFRKRSRLYHPALGRQYEFYRFNKLPEEAL